MVEQLPVQFGRYQEVGLKHPKYALSTIKTFRIWMLRPYLLLDKGGKTSAVNEVHEIRIPVRGLDVERNHSQEVSINPFSIGVKTKSKVRLTLEIEPAMISMCGGDDPRACYGRMTSVGGRCAGSQLRNRPPWSVRF